MSDLKDLDDLIEARRDRPQHPAGWAPGFEWDGQAGTLTTPPLESEPSDWDGLLAELGAPSFLTVDPTASVAFTSWDGWRRDADGPAVSAVQRSFRCRLTKRSAETFAYPELAAHIRNRKRAKVTPPTGDRWLVLPVADLQTGKRSGGGLRGLTDRVKAVEANLVAYVAGLRRAGVTLAGCAVVGMGDIVEGCGNSHYSYQGSDVVAGRRDQIKASKDLVWSIVDTVAPLFEQVLLTAVAGNHGEQRGAGGAITNPLQDNDDLLVFEWVADALAGNPRYDHVQARFPDDQLATSFDLAGTIVGFTHGHQFDRGAGLPVAKAIRWWEKQQMGRQPVADCDVLVYAHFHHPVVVEWSRARWLVQCPTIDGGSAYFEQGMGVSSSPGMACFVTGAGSYVDHWTVL